MNSEKSTACNSSIALDTALSSGNNGRGSSSRTQMANSSSSSSSRRGETADAEKEIDLHEFLEFLNISCHVNEVITSGNAELSLDSKSNAKRKELGVNFKKLADNRLVNSLYNSLYSKTSTTSKDGDDWSASLNEEEASARGFVGNAKSAISSSNITYPAAATTLNGGGISCPQTWQPWKKPELSRTSGTSLHPKLKEKLDFFINEGVLDSVLPFICPVQIPLTMTTATAATTTAAKGKVNKAKDACGRKEGIPVEPDATGSGITETDKETALVAAESTSGMVKLRDQRSIVRSLKTRSQNNSLVAVEEKREPEVVIHVCDEVKNTSRDFTCPQSLLVGKMGYFADVTAGQKLDDMDISVHCDIHIFDWLMRWVKHSVSGTDSGSGTASTAGSLDSGPQLDASNVVPILVSASFLQMEPLFADCLSFCHARLNEVVRVSSNLSCLNDSITTSLAAMFTNSELEMVRDKKERVTPRLWTKLIQSLCEPEPEALRGHYYSLAGLFRCSKCDKCLTNTLKSYISCLPSNVRLNRWGQVVSHHVRDSSWDINTFITQLFKEQKSWRKVYWKLWGHCHFLYCCICETHFPVYQMSWCRYHPEGPNFLGPVAEGRIAGPTGRYPCCGQQAFRFETMPGPNGCQFREHSVLVETDRERAILGIVQLVSEGQALCEPPPMKLQETIANGSDAEPRWAGLSLMPQRCRQGLLPVLNPDEPVSRIARRARGGASSTYFAESSSGSDTSDTLDELLHQSKRRLLHNTICPSFSTSSDGCESDYSDAKIRSSKKVIRKRQTETPGRHWSGELSARSNQDNQREFEEKVMKQVATIVSKKIGSEYTTSQASVPIGGTYVRLEVEWKDQLKQRNMNAMLNCSSSSYQHSTYATSSTANGGSSGISSNKLKNK